MKICFLSRADSVHIKRQVRWLADRGHEIYLISFEPYHYDQRIQLFLLHRSSLRIRRISFVLDAFQAAPQARRLLSRIEPDLVHAHYLTNYGLMGALAGYSPLICSAWGSDIFSPYSKSIPLRFAIKFAIMKSDFVTTTSDYAKEYIVDLFDPPRGKVVTLPWGIDLDVFRTPSKKDRENARKEFGLKANDFVILSPRNLKRFYGQENMIRSMPLIMRKYPNVFLIILTGFGKDKEMMKDINRMVREYGIRRNVKIIDRPLSTKEMISMYNVSDALISLPGWDQFSSCILEGMACSVIPIVSILGSYRAYLEHNVNALFVNRDDPRDIAEKVILCVENPALKERFSLVNRKIVEKKENLQRNLEAMEKFYERVVEGMRKVGE